MGSIADVCLVERKKEVSIDIDADLVYREEIGGGWGIKLEWRFSLRKAGIQVLGETRGRRSYKGRGWKRKERNVVIDRYGLRSCP